MPCFDETHPAFTKGLYPDRVIFIPGAWVRLCEEVLEVLGVWGVTITNRHPHKMRPGDYITVHCGPMDGLVNYSARPGLRGTRAGANITPTINEPYGPNRTQPICVYSLPWEWGTICHELGHLIIGTPLFEFQNPHSREHDIRENNIIATGFGRVIEVDQIHAGNGRWNAFCNGDQVPHGYGFVLFDINGNKRR